MVGIVLRVEKIFTKLPIYHVGLSYKCGPLVIKNVDFHPKFNGIRVKGEKRQIHLGNTHKNIIDILLFEQTMNKDYFLLFHDCRHYTKELLEYSTNKPYDLTNLFYLHSVFESDI
jgi:hypothetical protein